MTIGPEIPNTPTPLSSDNPKLPQQTTDAEQQKLQEVKDPQSGHFIKIPKSKGLARAHADRLGAYLKNWYSSLVQSVWQTGDTSKEKLLVDAVSNKNEVVAKSLLQSGAKLHFKGDSLSHRAIEMGTDALAQVIHQHNPQLDIYLHQVKMLVHRFALTGALKDFEGFWTSATLPELCYSAREYFRLSDNSSGSLRPTVILDALEDTLEKAEDVAKSMKRLEEGKIVTGGLRFTARIEDGLKNEHYSHATGFAICKRPSDGKYLFVKANRGLRGKSEQPGLSFYTISKPENINKALTTLMSNKTSAEEGQTYLEQTLHDDLGLEPLALQLTDKMGVEHVMEHKSQSIGNCAWASIKLLLEASVFADQWQQNRVVKECAIQARTTYKAFTSDDRRRAIEAFIEFIKTSLKEDLSGEKLTEAGLPPVEKMLQMLIEKIKDPQSLLRLLDVLTDGSQLSKNAKDNCARVICEYYRKNWPATSALEVMKKFPDIFTSSELADYFEKIVRKEKDLLTLTKCALTLAPLLQSKDAQYMIVELWNAVDESGDKKVMIDFIRYVLSSEHPYRQNPVIVQAIFDSAMAFGYPFIFQELHNADAYHALDLSKQVWSMDGQIKARINALLNTTQPFDESMHVPLSLVLKLGANPNLALDLLDTTKVTLVQLCIQLHRLDDVRLLFQDPRTNRDFFPLNTLPNFQTLPAEDLIECLKQQKPF